MALLYHVARARFRWPTLLVVAPGLPDVATAVWDAAIWSAGATSHSSSVLLAPCRSNCGKVTGRTSGSD